MSATAFGDFLGVPAGRAWIGGRRAKVLNWDKAGFGPTGDDDWVRVQVPRGLGPGPHDLVVRTRLGEAVLPEAVTVTDPGLRVKPDRQKGRAKLDGAGIPGTLRAANELGIFWARDSLINVPTAVDAAGVRDLVRRALDAYRLRIGLPAAGAPGDGEGADEFTTVLLARPGKTVRIAAVAVLGWDPVEDGSLLDGSALERQVAVLYIEQPPDDEARAWGGVADTAELFVDPVPSGRVGAIFSSAQMFLLLGGGPASIALEQGVILNAGEGALPDPR